MLQHLWLKALWEDHTPGLDPCFPLPLQRGRSEARLPQCIFVASTSPLGFRPFSLPARLLLVFIHTPKITCAKSLMKENVQDSKHTLTDLGLSWAHFPHFPPFHNILVPFRTLRFQYILAMLVKDFSLRLNIWSLVHFLPQGGSAPYGKQSLP